MTVIRSSLKRPRRSRPVRSVRDRILEIAANLIIDRGYSGCTMRAIAKSVGMKAASLYYHFPSKEKIVEEILSSSFARHLEVLNDALESLPSGASFADRIDAGIRGHLSNIFESDIPYVLVYQHLPPRMKLKSANAAKDYAHVWRELFQQGVRSGDVSGDVPVSVLVHILVVGMLDSAPEWFHLEKLTTEEFVQIVKRILFHGVSAPTAS